MPGSFTILREQIGQPETFLKESLQKIFEKHSEVRRAFLVVVRYDSRPDEHVALCLSLDHQSPDGNLLRDIAQLFEQSFAASQTLDIIAVNEEQERSLALECAPFYEAA